MTIQDLKERYLTSKEEYLKGILDSDLSKLDKIKLIGIDNLFPIESGLSKAFLDKRFIDALGGIGPGYYYDSIFDLQYSEGGRGISYYYSFLNDLDDYDTVLSNGKSKLELSREEIIDYMYEYCINNKTIGFTFDH